MYLKILCDSLLKIMVNLKSQINFAICVIKHSFYTYTSLLKKQRQIIGMTYEMLGDAAWWSNGLIIFQGYLLLNVYNIIQIEIYGYKSIIIYKF